MRNTLSTGMSSAIARQLAKAREVRLVLEFERPGERALQVHAVARGELVFAREAGGRVARVHGAVAIAEARALAGGAAFGIRLADDDGLAGQRGPRGDHPEARVDRGEMRLDAHAHVAVDKARRALGVKREKVGGRALLAGRVVLSVP